jgi:hypothetical protein
MFGVVLVVPGLLYSSFSQCKERALDGGPIIDWLGALSGNGLDDLDIFQRVLMGLSGFQASVRLSRLISRSDAVSVPYVIVKWVMIAGT